MTSVIVSKDQAEAMGKAGELVEIRNQSGEVIGFFAPLKLEYAEEYAQMAARTYSIWGADGPPKKWYTSEEVFAHLKSLEEKQ